MKRNISLRETLAWILIVCAGILLSVTIAFAQDKKKGSTTIKIIKKEDGKTIKIDTTLDSNDHEAIEKILKDLDLDHDMSFNFSFPEPPDVPGEKHRSMKFHYKGISKKQRDDLKKDMDNLKDEMKDLHEKLKDIHIEIFSDEDGNDGKGFSYHYNVPPVPPIPPSAGDFDFDLFNDHDLKKLRHHHFNFSIPDSLNDDEHTVIMGDEDESPPVFEKEVKGKHGEKIFIYKRSKPAESKSKDESSETKRIKLYPNPNDGKFTVNFHASQKKNMIVRVYDHLGKEVYSESINDFIGDYENEIDLSSKGKGNYILKITYGDQTSVEKFVIE